MNRSVKNMLIATLLQVAFSVVELVGGLLAGSVSAISTAVRDFECFVWVGVAVWLESRASKRPDSRYTYGYARASLLGALFVSVLLLLGSLVVVYNSVYRLIRPEPVNNEGLFLVALGGIILNGIAARKTAKKKNLNEKALSLHFFHDMLTWAAVLVGDVVIQLTGFYRLDPLLSLLITVFVLVHVVRHIQEIAAVFLEKTPPGVLPEEVKAALEEVAGVQQVQQLRVWSLDGHHGAMTARVALCAGVSPAAFEEIKQQIRGIAAERGLEHTVIEPEWAEETPNNERT